MFRSKNSVFNGLVLSGSRPLHPLLMEYLSIKGCKVRYEDGYIILDGAFSLPGHKGIFIELIELSKKLHGEIVFDLEMQITSWGTRGFEVVDKKPNQTAKISTIPFEKFDQEIIDLLFIEYLLNKDAVIYLGANKEICYLAGNEPVDQNELVLEAKEFISSAIYRMQIQQGQILTPGNDAAPSEILDIDSINNEFRSLLTVKFYLEHNCQVAHHNGKIIYLGKDVPDSLEVLAKQKNEFISTEYTRLQRKGLIITAQEAPTPKQETRSYTEMLTAFSNRFFGSSKETSRATNTATPRPRL